MKTYKGKLASTKLLVACNVDVIMSNDLKRDDKKELVMKKKYYLENPLNFQIQLISD